MWQLLADVLGNQALSQQEHSAKAEGAVPLLLCGMHNAKNDQHAGWQADQNEVGDKAEQGRERGGDGNQHGAGDGQAIHAALQPLGLSPAELAEQ